MWSASAHDRLLIEQYAARLRAGNASVFVGAGLSVPSGLLAWKDLLREPALSLGLDIEAELHDLPLVAQYFVNQHRGDPTRLHEYIRAHLYRDTTVTPSHITIANLPLNEIWTTNYDDLLEKALQQVGKNHVVRICGDLLNDGVPHTDTVVYKLHGSIDNAGARSLVFTRSDYEQYPFKYERMWHALQRCLIQQSFMFVGFSFGDPNVHFAFAAVKQSGSVSPHINVTRRPASLTSYEERKFDLWCEELGRVGVDTIVVPEFEDVPRVLHHVELAVGKKRIFIGGSHADASLSEFLEELGAELVGRGFSIVSGAGLDGGDIVVRGAISGITRCPSPLETPIEIYPFWSRRGNEATTVELQRDRKNRIRRQIIRTCAFCIFVAGREGTYDEYLLSTELSRVALPIGFTGGTAARIATELLARTDIEPSLHDFVRDFATPPADPGNAAQTVVERLALLSEAL